MLPILGIAATIAIYIGFAFILSKTAPIVPSKWAYRFGFLFVMGLPLNFVLNYFNVQLLGYHKMGWGGASIIALLLALFFATSGSFWEPLIGTDALADDHASASRAAKNPSIAGRVRKWSGLLSRELH